MRPFGLCLTSIGWLVNQISHTRLLHETPVVLQDHAKQYTPCFNILSQVLSKTSKGGFSSLLVLYRAVDWAAIFRSCQRERKLSWVNAT